jgi:hypothetical protein
MSQPSEQTGKFFHINQIFITEMDQQLETGEK